MKRIIAIILAAALISPAFATQPAGWWQGAGYYLNNGGHNLTYFATKPGGHVQWVFAYSTPPVTPPVVPPVEVPPTVTPPATPTTPAAQPSAPAQPAQQEPAKANKGSKVAGGIAFAVVLTYFMWVICDREGIAWCQAPFKGPMDDRFDQERYGVQ